MELVLIIATTLIVVLLLIIIIDIITKLIFLLKNKSPEKRENYIYINDGNCTSMDKEKPCIPPYSMLGLE